MPGRVNFYGLEALAPRSANVPTPKQPSAGKKRKADSPPPTMDPYSIDCGSMRMDKNCDQVRRQIRTFLDSGEMTQKAFGEKIGVSDHSLRTFLGQSGKMKGARSNTYDFAWEFFKSREMCGIKMPSKKKRTGSEGTQKGEVAGSGNKAAGNTSGVDISQITLAGEEDDNVHIYDSCDEIRKKINAHLRAPGVTKAQFCRDLQAQMHTSSAPKFQSTLITRFRGMSGPTHGNSNSVYYAAFVYFEKVRLAEGKEKSKHRLGMEKAWVSGVDREKSRGFFWCHESEQPHEDEFGQVSFY